MSAPRVTRRSRSRNQPPPSAPSPPAGRFTEVAKAAAFFTAVFAAKITVALQLDTHPLLQPDTGLDTTAYAELANRVVGGDVALGQGLYYVSPLYIYFLASVYALAHSFTAARVLQAALGTLSVGLIFLTARGWFGRRAAWAAAVLAGLTGLFTYYEALILQAGIDPVLTAAALWLLTLAVRREGRRFPLLAGLVLGIATLNRPNMVLAAAGVVAMFFAARRFTAGALLVLGVAAGLAPVTARNIVVAHQWSLVSSHGGINFYIGNGEGASGYFHAVAGMPSTIEGLAFGAHRVAEKALRRPLTDAEVSSYFSGLAWTWIRQHPAGWVRLLLRKTYGVFNAAHVSIPFSYTFYAYDAGTLLRFCLVGPWLLVPLGLFGLLRGAASVVKTDVRTWSRPYGIWLSFVPFYAASVVLFFVTERYQLPLYVPLAVGAGAGIDLLCREIAAKRWGRLAASSVALLVLFVAANWPLHLDDGRAEERTRMAEFMAGRGHTEEAEHWTALALAIAPDPAAVHYRVGAQFVNSRQAAPALVHLTRAAGLHPGDPRTEYALGVTLVGNGRPGEAVPHLRRAVQVGGADVPLAGYELAVALQRTGDLAGAARALSELKPPPETTVDAWLQLGRLAGEIKAPDVGERFFRQAVTRAPGLARTHHLLGLDLLVLGRYEEAARELGAAAQLDARDGDAMATLAFCEAHLGRFNDARTHAQAALRINPEHQVARGVLGRLEQMPRR